MSGFFSQWPRHLYLSIDYTDLEPQFSTALTKAARFGHQRVIKELVALGANVNGQDKGKDLLYLFYQFLIWQQFVYFVFVWY